ncbi:MAG: hypothetical protein ACEPO2_13550 [Pelagibaca sp.]
MIGGSGEVTEARRRIAKTLQVYGGVRFDQWSHGGLCKTVRAGFVQTKHNSDTGQVESTFYFMAEPLAEVLAGLDFRAVVSELMAAGVIVPQIEKGKEVSSKVFHVPSGGAKFRLYQIDPDKLGDGNEDATGPGNVLPLADVVHLPNGRIAARDPVDAAFCNLDLTGCRLSDREKFAFAVDAVNRWEAFVESVQRVEALIRLYEEGTTLPQIGGKPHE